MDVAADMLKPTEAAVVARVALRDVNRVIDERILPEGFVSLDDGRRVAATACTMISFYFDSAGRLTSEERLFAIREVGSRLHGLRARAVTSLTEEDWIVRDEFLTIDLAPFVRRTKERMDRLAAARQMVVSDPEILGGRPLSVARAFPSMTSRPRLRLAFPRSGSSQPTRRSTRIRSSLPHSTPKRTLHGAALDRAMRFPRAPSFSPTDGSLAAASPDEVLGRRVSKPGIDQARPGPGIRRVIPCRLVGACRPEGLGAEARDPRGRLDLRHEDLRGLPRPCRTAWRERPVRGRHDPRGADLSQRSALRARQATYHTRDRAAGENAARCKIQDF